MKWILLMIVGVAVNGAWAENESHPRQIYTCLTSRGPDPLANSFDYPGRDIWLTQELVVEACVAGNELNREECEANVACNDGYENSYYPFVTCDTFSRPGSMSNAYQSRSSAFASKKALESCLSNPYANPRECAANVSCTPPYDLHFQYRNPYNPYNPYEFGDYEPVRKGATQECSTFSRGKYFLGVGRDAEKTALTYCRRSLDANYEVCEHNLGCNNYNKDELVPFIRCEAMSNGMSGVENVRGDIALARREAIFQCQLKVGTSFEDCAKYVKCQSS